MMAVKPSTNYFNKLRQAWIMEMIYIYGYVNRTHLRRKFGISIPQASQDIRQFLEAHPGELAYNDSSKRYEAKNYKI